MEVVHTIIKEETKGKALEELKALAIQEKSNIFVAIDDGRIHTDLIEDLIIFENQSRNQSLVVNKNESYKIFKEIFCLKSFEREKRSIYMQRKILQTYKESYLYPFSHNIIRRYLKIPIGTWSKLKKEVEMMEGGLKIPKCRNNSKPSLGEKEKDFIKAIVKPPTYPLTINSILVWNTSST